MLALAEPDDEGEDPDDPYGLDEDSATEFPPLDPVLTEADRLAIASAEELLVVDRAPPKGWRVDVFGCRTVHVPPWSRRPPTVMPEPWVYMTKKVQNEHIERWRTSDPAAFDKQKRRHQKYKERKRSGRVPGVVGFALSPHTMR